MAQEVVRIIPVFALMRPGDTMQFTANAAVKWSCNLAPDSIDSNGIFTMGMRSSTNAPTCFIVATSTTDATKSAVAIVGQESGLDSSNYPTGPKADVELSSF